MVSTETSRYFSYLYKEQWICFLTCSFMKKAQVYNVLVVLLYNFHLCYFLVFTYCHFPFCFKYEARLLIQKKNISSKSSFE